MAQAPRCGAVAAEGFEAGALRSARADRAEAMGHPDPGRVQAELREHAGREPRQVELMAVGTAARREHALAEKLRMTRAQGRDDRLVDLITTAPGGGTHRSAKACARRAERPDPRLDHSRREPPPTGMDRRHRLTVGRGDEDRDTIGRHDPDPQARRLGNEGIGFLGRAGAPALGASRANAVDLAGKHCGIRRLRAAFRKAVCDTGSFENGIA